MSQSSNASPNPSGNTRPRRRLTIRFVWILVLSAALHLVFTPLVGWIGLGVFLLRDRPALDEANPTEDLKEIPIELSELFAEPPAAGPAQPPLPAEDPVGLIEEMLPVAQRVDPVTHPAPNGPEPDTAAAPSAEPPPSAAPPATAEPQSSAAPSLTTEPSSSPPADAGAPAPTATGPAIADTPPPRDPIDNPVALAGKAADLEKAPPHVAVALFMDRIRSHELGRRVAQLLPLLPQWDDYFGSSDINPVRDFDRLVMFGPSFVKSSELIVVAQHHVPAAKVRAAVDQLVRRRGNWLPKQKIPAALTFADRAERLVFMPNKALVVIVPPRLREDALKATWGIPDRKTPEAAVVKVAKPRAPMARVGIDVPASITEIRARVTPLTGGGVEIDLVAVDEDAETAQVSAEQMMKSINATIDLVSGVSNVLSRFGFGGFGGGARFARVALEVRGKEIHGHQVLSAEQVAFILDRVERQLVNMRPAAAASSAGGSNARPQVKRP